MHSFHFIYLIGDKTIPFNINHYLSVKSNLVVNDGEGIIWTNNEKVLLENIWIKKLYEEFPSRFTVFDINQIIVPAIENLIGINILKTPYMAHAADMARLFIMNMYGGAYSDVDSIAVHKIPDDWWWSVPTFCMETNSLDCLCNGFFLTPPNNGFLEDWLLGWRFYDPEECKPGTANWTKYSVQYGYCTYLKYKKNIRILLPKSFQPLYLTYDDTLDLFFLDKLSDLQLNSDVYEVHLWETRNQPILKLLNERYFLEGNSTYAKLGKLYL